MAIFVSEMATSLASQLSGPKSAIAFSTPPHFSGLRPSSNFKLDNTRSFFQNVDSHKGCRPVVSMAGSGKVYNFYIIHLAFVDFISLLGSVCNLN